MHGKIVWKAAGIAAALAVGGTLASPVAAHGPEHRTADRGASFRVDSESDAVDKRIGDGRCADARGRCTLRAAVQEANATSKPVTITLHRSVDLRVANAAGDEEAAATGDLDVTGDVTITGSRSARIDARGIDRAFEVMPGGSLDLTAVKITGGVVTGGADAVVGSGGGIANHGELSLAYVTIEGNRAVGPMASGGGVLNTGSLTATHSTFSRNEATRAGGAIEASGGTTKVRYSTMRDNVTGPTPGNGGALHLTGDGHVEVRRSSVVRNTASAEGGGLWNSATGTMVVDGGSYVDNVAAGAAADNGGGALFNDGGTLYVDGAYFGKNDATGAAGSGGGILNAGGTLVVTRSTIEKNTASRAGGGIEAVDGSTELSKVSLLGNTTGAAPGNGGGLHISGNGDASVTDSTVAWNVAASEGGGLWNNTGTMTVTRVLLKGNVAEGAEADSGGGALFNNGGTMRVSESTIRSNRATGAAGSGGGILNGLGVLEVSATAILDNRATRAGGGIEAVEGTTDVRTVTFTGNRTGSSPGNGGALHLTGPGTVTIADTHVSRNAAAAEGGGLWNSSNGTMTAESTTVRKNSAPSGPNVFNDGGTFVLNGEPVPNGNT